MSIVDVLARCPEELPAWLRDAEPTFTWREFSRGRTVYYPGSWYDGHPVKLSAPAHAAHAFIYVDCAYSQPEVAERVGDTQSRFPGYEAPFLGYALLRARSVGNDDLPLGANFPFAWLAVLKREDRYGDAHGPERLAVLFIGADGHNAFRALYCGGDGAAAPYLVVAQNHHGRSFDVGRASVLAQHATQAGQRPTYLLVGKNTEPWCGYDPTGAQPECGGASWHPRQLYVRRTGSRRESRG